MAFFCIFFAKITCLALYLNLAQDMDFGYHQSPSLDSAKAWRPKHICFWIHHNGGDEKKIVYNYSYCIMLSFLSVCVAAVSMVIVQIDQ